MILLIYLKLIQLKLSPKSIRGGGNKYIFKDLAISKTKSVLCARRLSRKITILGRFLHNSSNSQFKSKLEICSFF